MRLSFLRLHRGAGAHRRKSRGQSLVEFALILPVLILLLLVTIDFGRLFLSYVSLNNTVRVAANYGSLNVGPYTGTTLASYNSTVTAESNSIVGTCPIEDTAGTPDPGNPPVPTYPNGTDLGDPSRATMTCHFAFLTPFISAFFGGSLPMTATAQFPVRTGALANIGGGTGIPVPGAPVAAFSFITGGVGTVDAYGNATGPDPYTLNFQDQSQNAQTWDWTFNNGSPDWTTDGTPPAETFKLNGSTSPLTFTVTLTVSNPAGSSSVSHTVTVEPTTTNPVAGFYGTPVGSAPQVSGGGSGGTPIEGVVSTTVNFLNTSAGANSYSWAFGDGGTSTQTAPSHAYNALGVYSVTLTITDPTGASPFTRSSYVSIGCVVPNFNNLSTSAAASTYSGAGLTGTLWYQQSGTQSRSKTPPNPSSNIVSQTGQPGGNWVAPTKQGNQPYGCNYDVTVVYQ